MVVVGVKVGGGCGGPAGRVGTFHSQLKWWELSAHQLRWLGAVLYILILTVVSGAVVVVVVGGGGAA